MTQVRGAWRPAIAAPDDSPLTRARQRAGLTEKELAERLEISLWQMERLERGELEMEPYLAVLEEHTGIPRDELQADGRRGPHDETDGRARRATARARESLASARRGLAAAPWPVWLVLGSVTTLVTMRFFSETVPVLPNALNVIDIPILLALAGAAATSERASRGVRPTWLLPLAVTFLFLCAIAAVANPTRVEIGPALTFIYGILGPLVVYGAVYRLWPPSQAARASRLIVVLGVIQLIVVFTYQVPTFMLTGDPEPDRISGTFGNNAYQLVFFLLLFVTLVGATYVHDPGRLTARFAPLLIPAALAAIVFAQYRALIVTMGLAVLLIALILSIRGRGVITAVGMPGALVLVLVVAASSFPILKLDRFFELDPGDLARERISIVDQLDSLYSDEPRFIATGTGPGTYSSRGWYTFARADSESASNVVGGYVLALAGDETYSTDVSEKYLIPQGESVDIVSGSRAVNSPFASYISVAAEVGILGLVVLLAIYGGALLVALGRAVRLVRVAAPGDPLPAIMLAAATGLFVLMQMGVLNNWLEVARLTFIAWALLAIANKEFDSRGASPEGGAQTVSAEAR
jgi:transcriptional regulator with XRE-family HTH domain